MLDTMLIKIATLIWTLTIIWDIVSAHGGETRIPWHSDLVSNVCFYTREDLLNLRYSFKEPPKLLFSPPEIIHHGWSNKKKKKKRGSRGGIRNRIKRRGSHFPLPTVTLSNVRSLQNKMHELSALIKFDRDFSRANLICLTETWLNEDIKNINLDGYSLVRYDRDTTQTAKRIGGPFRGVYVRKGDGAVRGTVDVPTQQSFLDTVAWTP
ncbi:hypothetical protein N1851_009261 [Merluccius polli]|uniref:Uncharacterized protein n=1 Tax=Merluccius polli TaxID=89951 RepID=A0AA47P763_MERPO|nr:hypothetical protein N1851_009261 [Merluccius polli]